MASPARGGPGRRRRRFLASLAAWAAVAPAGLGLAASDDLEVDGPAAPAAQGWSRPQTPCFPDGETFWPAHGCSSSGTSPDSTSAVWWPEVAWPDPQEAPAAAGDDLPMVAALADPPAPDPSGPGVAAAPVLARLVHGLIPAVAMIDERLVEVDAIVEAMFSNRQRPLAAGHEPWRGAEGLTLSPELVVTLAGDDAGDPPPCRTVWPVTADGVFIGTIAADGRPRRLPLHPAGGAPGWSLEKGAGGDAVASTIEFWPPAAGDDALSRPLAADALDLQLSFDVAEATASWRRALARIERQRRQLRKNVAAVQTLVIWLGMARDQSGLFGPSPHVPDPGDDGASVALSDAALRWATEVAIDVPLRWITPDLWARLGGAQRRRQQIIERRVVLAQTLDAACVLTAILDLAPLAAAGALVETAVQRQEYDRRLGELGEDEADRLLAAECGSFWEVGLDAGRVRAADP